MNWHLQDGNGLKIQQKTNYPWDGDVKIKVCPSTPSEFVVYVRIPGWSAHSVVKVNGEQIDGAQPGNYLAIRRHWSANEVIELSFDMTTQLLQANPAVSEDRSRVAFQRGPVVFCMEHLDQSDQEHGMNLAGYAVKLDSRTTARFEPGLLNGVMVLEHPGAIRQALRDRGLYYPADNEIREREIPATVKLIPYYAWANRAPASMQVWIPYRQA